MAFVSVVSPVYAPSSLWTVNFSCPPVWGTMKTFSLEVHTESGYMPCSSAAARSNALKEDPGWRSPSVAMLKGLWA